MSDIHKKVKVDGVEVPPIPKTKIPFYIDWQAIAVKLQEENLARMLAEVEQEKQQ